MIREPAVAGLFYPGEKNILNSLIESYIVTRAEKKRAYSIVSPHAGYEYSGKVAGAVFSSVIIPDKCIVIGPSHRYARPTIAVMRSGHWMTPLGGIPVDTWLADKLLYQSKKMQVDHNSHIEEHSIEVQMPFLRYLNPKISFVPISIGAHAVYEDLEDLGQALESCIRSSGQEVLIVASTDMSHYVSAQEAKKFDSMAIDRIINLDARGLYDVVAREGISMCGCKPTSATLIACKALGAAEGELIDYRTSGEVTGDSSSVVGYCGIRIV